jgi:hypothetical protein
MAEFWGNKRNHDGLSYKCKTCSKEYQQKWWREIHAAKNSKALLDADAASGAAREDAQRWLVGVHPLLHQAFKVILRVEAVITTDENVDDMRFLKHNLSMAYCALERITKE